MQLLSIRERLSEPGVRLSVSEELRDMRREDASQALHMQQPRPRHEHAPPDLPIRHSDGAPQLLQLLAPLPELLPVQPAIQPVQRRINIVDCHLGCREHV